jgi:hypothetical protein
MLPDMSLPENCDFAVLSQPLSFKVWRSFTHGQLNAIVKERAYLKIPKQMNIRHSIPGEVWPAKVRNLSSTRY